ncbi:hypothetical protein ACGFYQ_33840 [Streptomyces sp. NPDC048258]|uniref:hypothetical protein n=1 Tax=Streptomyces sp. NPDC048258 TaxID=3365527 RepID=UPI0037233C97
MTTAPAAPAVPDITAELAARRSRPWTATPHLHAMRHGAPCARLTDGVRALLIVQPDDARVEVFAEYPEEYPATVAIVAEATGPHAAAGIAAQLLRTVLPRLDAESGAVSARSQFGCNQVLQRHLGDMTELGFTLIDHGAHPDAVESARGGPGLVWATANGGTWGVWVLGAGEYLSARYDGPVNGLFGVLPFLLPSAEGRTPADVGSAFTRYLTDQFPQLVPIEADEVMLPCYRQPGGYIVLPDELPTGYADDQTPVVGEFSALGVDLLLAAAAQLI